MTARTIYTQKNIGRLRRNTDANGVNYWRGFVATQSTQTNEEHYRLYGYKKTDGGSWGVYLDQPSQRHAWETSEPVAIKPTLEDAIDAANDYEKTQPAKQVETT